MLRNKTSIECWNIIKYVAESTISICYPKQGKWTRKQHLSKEAIRKVLYRQTMWRVYRRTRKDEDYTNYKQAFNADTNEI